MAPGLFFYKQNLKKIAMKNNINKKTQVTARYGEIWDISIGFFRPVLLLKYDIPTDILNVKFKVILN